MTNYWILVLIIATVSAESGSQQKSSACRQELQELDRIFKDGNPVDLVSLDFNYVNGVKDINLVHSCNKSPGKKYAILLFKPNPPAQKQFLFVGYCGPSSCHVNDYTTLMETNRQVIEIMFAQILKEDVTGLLSFEAFIPYETYPPFDIKAFFSFSILLLIIGASVAGLFHRFSKQTKSQGAQTLVEGKINQTSLILAESGTSVAGMKESRNFSFLTCFDPVANVAKLFQPSPRADPNLSIFHGVRVLLIYWVILNHEFVDALFWTSNQENIPGLTTEAIALFIKKADFSVDGFLFMSGFFFVYVFRAQNFSAKEYGRMVIHRLMRIVPIYLVVILLNWKVIQFFGNGPLLQIFARIEDEKCSQNGLLDLFFLNNLIIDNPTNDCIGWGWYLACDMQIYLVIPFIILLAYRNKSKGKTIIWGLIIVSIIYTFFLTYFGEYPALGGGGFNAGYSRKYYLVPWTRISPYLLGVLVAIWYMNERDSFTQAHKNSRALQLIISLLGLFTIYSIIIVLFPLLTDPNYFSYFWQALHLSGSRIIFTAGLCAFLLPGLLGSKFLSCILGNRFFEVMAKLTFSSYLVHPVIQHFRSYNREFSIEFSYLSIFQCSLETAIVSVCAAFLLFVFVEAPFGNLEQHFFRGDKKKAQHSLEMKSEEKSKA